MTIEKSTILTIKRTRTRFKIFLQHGEKNKTWSSAGTPAIMFMSAWGEKSSRKLLLHP
jgi:hypothetical protein